MADFVDDFPDEELLDILGDSITHVTESGVVVQGKAVLYFDIETDEYSSDRQTQIELLKADFASPLQRGDKIVHNSKTYILDSIIARFGEQLDGRYERWGLISG